jgi:hypothetical protein
MSQQDNQRYKVLMLLADDKAPKDIAEQLDVSYATVLRYRKELEQAKIDGTIKSLLDVPAIMLDEIASFVASNSPITVDNETAVIVEGVKGLGRLQDEFQSTAELISRRIRALIMSAQTPGELADLTASLCEMQKAFFNSNSVNLNIQNNLSPDNASTKYGKFLSDRPQD